jgi:3-oxoacyl-[acyl-carrier protein] reductase
VAALAGRVAIVTGASRLRGIGAAIARALSTAGAAVFTTWNAPYDASRPWRGDPRDPQLLLEDLRERGGRADGCAIDLADPAAASETFERAEASFGPVDVLVNNAAHSEPGGIDELTAVALDAHYAVNVRGAALLCAEFVRRFERRAEDAAARGVSAPGARGAAGAPRGRIVNLTSGQGAGAMPGELAYVASKGAIDALTVSLAAELAPRGITVNAVDPGATDTGWMSADQKRSLEEQSPMRRVGTPEDAARLVLFLCSPEGGWITGQVLRSRGGA